MGLFEAAMVLPDGVREIDAPTLHQHLGKVRIVDVREPFEYTGELGHIDGAELIPLGNVAQNAATWDKQAEVVLVCKSGGRSGQATRYFQGNGFARVINLRGGMMGWNAAGLPIKR